MNGNDLERLVVKIKKNLKEIGADLGDYPESETGKYFANKSKAVNLGSIFNWTQSFFTGMAYWAYLKSKDNEILRWLYSYYNQYFDKVFKTPMDTMHDLGFLYTPYAVALFKLTGDPKMRELGIKAADDLAMRYVPDGKYIQAWGRMDKTVPGYISDELKKDVFFSGSEGRVIVDSMMNLPLLFWAGRQTGHPFYGSIAISHANTVLEHFVRSDNSVCHAFLFDPKTGNVIKEANSCGYANGSHWARGTAWAVYGFAIAYSYTADKRYLKAAVDMFEKFIKECGGKMPVWDFRLPESETPNIDTSAVAVMLCAALEIKKHIKNESIEKFADEYDEMLEKYIDFDLKNNGLLREQNGRKVYTSYGDYFLVEYLSMKYENAERIW